MTDIKTWTLVFVVITFGIYIYIAYASRVSTTSGFYVASGGIPAPSSPRSTAGYREKIRIPGPITAWGMSTGSTAETCKSWIAPASSARSSREKSDQETG